MKISIKKIKIIENLKTIFYALIIAILIRSILYQPFYIPSSSMEPTLLIGDRIFVSKFSYGYSKHSFPFSPNIFSNRFFFNEPKRGDLVVFKTPADNRTDYIKRLIGLPGETIQIKDGQILINKQKIVSKLSNKKTKIRCGPYQFETKLYEEELPNGVKYIAAYSKDNSQLNSDEYIVPANHYFLLGDNRDCSKDSRFLTSVGYVPKLNLVGRANIIFFSNDTEVSPLIKFWNIKESLRFNRFFNVL